MLPRQLALQRMINQRLGQRRCDTPAEAVSHLGAMQAQDYGAALWAIGVRTAEATEEEVEEAIARREIVRTWPMRGTLHFVSRSDVFWMLDLLAARAIASAAGRHRQLELDDDTFRKARHELVRTLEGGHPKTRDELFELLRRKGVSTAGQRGYHILVRLSQEGLICLASRRGKQPTFALLEDWVGPKHDFDRAEALAKLATRYFASHGPATLQDFVWWTGLKVVDARAAIESVSGDLLRETVSGTEYWFPCDGDGGRAVARTVELLPGYDEMLLGYTDRSASLNPEYAGRITPGNNGVFMPTLIRAGAVFGTWKRTSKKDYIGVEPQPFETISQSVIRATTTAANRLSRFLQREVKLTAVS